MVAIQHQIDTVRGIGEIALQILQVGAVAASYNCPVNEDDKLVLEEDDQYWENLLELKTVLEQYGDVRITNANADIEDYNTRTLQIEDWDESGVQSRFMLDYHANGMLLIGGSMVIGDQYHNIIDDFINHVDEDRKELTELEVGRAVARGELLVLANTLESGTSTLDYWMVQEAPYSKYDHVQSKWAELRGVSRQAVNGSLNTARRKLENLEASQ